MDGCCQLDFLPCFPYVFQCVALFFLCGYHAHFCVIEDVYKRQIIASINCYQNADWVEFAAKIEEAGADALEINILALQTDVVPRPS